MMISFQNMSIRSKLIVITTIASGIAIILATIAFVFYDQYSYKESTISDMEVLADVIGINCTTSLLFQDSKDAIQVLNALSANSNIEEALLFNTNGELFASYRRGNVHRNSETHNAFLSKNELAEFIVAERKIVFELEQIGTIILVANKSALYNRLQDFGQASIIIISTTLALLLLIVYRIERFVTQPITELAATAKSVSDNRDYSLRAKRLGNDEVGLLVNTFNDMLGQLSNHERELTKTNDELEQRVSDRTIDLQEQIRQRVGAEKTLAKSERRFRAMIEKSSDIIIVVGIDGLIKYISPSLSTMLNIKPDNIIGKNVEPYIHPADFPELKTNFIKILRKPGATVSIDCRYRDSNNVWRNIETFMSNLVRECGGIVFNARDITERKEAENTIKASLQEKEVLLKEIHHRVKNNLQVICSLLNIQQSKHSDETIIRILKDSEFRVKSMALIHEKLYRSHDLANIDIADYTKNLVTILFRSFEGNRSNVRLEFDMEQCFLGVDQAVPLGLIINELVSNSLKHAFKNVDDCRLSIKSKQLLDDKYEVIISDNGKGLPSDLDELKTQSLGLQLVYTLVNQIDGGVTHKSESGTQWTICFPITKHKVEVLCNEKK